MPHINWEGLFAQAGAFWKHDGKRQRPYALLTSKAPDGRRRISDVYFNGDRVIRRPALLAQAGGYLAHHSGLDDLLDKMGGTAPMHRAPTSQSDVWEHVPDTRIRIGRVIGAERGAITLNHEIARHFGCEKADAIRPTRINAQGEEVVIPGVFSFERFEPDFVENEFVLSVEDTVTTGGTTFKMRDAFQRSHPTARLLPCVLALCNRSGKTQIEDVQVFSLIMPNIRVWNEGENPFTPDGKEIVEPLRPKGRSWEILNANYA